jgi:hypothetical protein
MDTIMSDDDLQAVHEGFVTVVLWLRFWAAEGHIFHSDGPVPLTRGVRSDLKALASELEWVARMLPITASGDSALRDE